ncbi:unnamed protein product [Closterium sp. Naga37s-1]|nr:unnamed protein product [Closterium sp. Naga37s-1]
MLLDSLDLKLDTNALIVTLSSVTSLAREFQRRGANVFATSRRVDTMKGLKEKGVNTLALDVTSEPSIQVIRWLPSIHYSSFPPLRAVVKEVASSAGREDVLAGEQQGAVVKEEASSAGREHVLAGEQRQVWWAVGIAILCLLRPHPRLLSSPPLQAVVKDVATSAGRVDVLVNNAREAVKEIMRAGRVDVLVNNSTGGSSQADHQPNGAGGRVGQQLNGGCGLLSLPYCACAASPPLPYRQQSSRSPAKRGGWTCWSTTQRGVWAAEFAVLCLRRLPSPPIQAAVKQITSQTGRVDVLVNNAGCGLPGPLAELPMARIKEVRCGTRGWGEMWR